VEVSIAFTGAPDGDDGPFVVGRSAEWLALAHRIRGRSALAELIETGTFHGTDALSRELARLPAGPVADRLRELVGLGHPEETAVIMDPNASEDDEDE
jgi:hypothetical protein